MVRYYPTNVVRPDEIFWKTKVPPDRHTIGSDWFIRRVKWILDDKTFSSYILFWVFRWYHGTGKIDASQTYRLRAVEPGFVVATTPKEMASFRLSISKPDRERWDNMGGI